MRIAHITSQLLWQYNEKQCMVRGARPAKPVSMMELTKDFIAQSRVIAKGERIRDLQRLVDTHGGQRSKWVKKSSPTFENGNKMYEYHWYEYHGIGKFEIKCKKVS